MNISLTRQELVMLLRMASIGDWVMFADLEGDEWDAPNVRAHKKVLQKLLAAAYKAKMDGVVHYAPVEMKYYETGEFEEDYLQFVDEFKEQEFWEMLADRLAARDLADQIGEEAFKAMDWIERVEKLEKLSSDYEKEFMEYGLERLHLLNTKERGNA